MKRCSVCNVVYENNMSVCPTCGSILDSVQNENYNYAATPVAPVYVNSRTQTGSRYGYQAGNEYIFERTEGFTTVINGVVSEFHSIPYYQPQSKLTKFFRSVFGGEPWQFPYNSGEHIVRLDEHTVNGYPERSLDITIFGSLRSHFAVGDDVTIWAKRCGNRYIARRIYNHSTDSVVDIQGNIPAAVIRGLTALVLILLVTLINVISSINFAALFASIISSLFPFVIIGAVIWYISRRFRRKA